MNEIERNIYEITFYTKEENAAPVKDAIRAHHGEVMEERPPEKVRFEFPVKKESFAFLGVFRAALAPEEVAPLTRALTLTPSVLRFLITTAKTIVEGSREERKPVERKRPPSPRVTSSEPEVLTNEAIEKKIEEILQ